MKKIIFNSKIDNWQWWTLLSLPVWPALIVLLGSQRYAALNLDTWTTSYFQSLEWVAFQWVPWAILSPCVFWIACSIYLDDKFWVKKILRLFSVGFVLVLIHTGLQALAKSFGIIENDLQYGTSYWFLYLFLVKAHAEFLVYFAIVVFVLACRFIVKSEMEVKRSNELEAALASKELANLRKQLAPHFLFNALNSLCGLLSEDSKAHEMTLKISNYLRLVLDKQKLTYSTFAEEVDMAKAYISVEKLRYGNRLEITWQGIDKFKHQKLPAMFLQPILENAVVHAVAKSSLPTTISVNVEQNNNMFILSVFNQSQTEIRLSTSDNGIGLTSIKESIMELYREDVILSWGFKNDFSFEVVVKVPLCQ